MKERIPMIAIVLVAALAACMFSAPAYAKPTPGFVVQFASSTNPDVAARELQRLQKSGLKEIQVVSSPLKGGRHIYRVVSRRFTTYAEARLAALGARRLLTRPVAASNGVILAANAAGRPIIR
jgi:hypothetical protein